jgi:predicted dehydrogenase
MSQIKVAIVGTGMVAQDSYLPCLMEEKDIALGYFNRTPAGAETCASRFPGQVFPSLAELMDWQPDTILVLTRETQRSEAARALLQYNPRRLFFEKPLVARHGQENVTEDDFFDGREILLKAESKGVETAMVFNYRFFEHTLLARRIVAERDFGRVLNVSGLVHYACWSHAIDLIHFFAGPLETISALEGKIAHKGGGVNPAMQMLARDMTLSFTTGAEATGTLIGTNALAWTFPLYELTFNFEGGRLRMVDLDGDLEVMASRGMEVETYHIAGHRSRWDQYNSSFKKSIHAYLDSIRHAHKPPVPGYFGLLELQVEAGIKHSIAQSRPVRLADDFPLQIKLE